MTTEPTGPTGPTGPTSSPAVAGAPRTATRRDALRLGGVTVSLAALVAACGDDREGDTSPGRVGYAPPATDLPDWAVDDAVLLRTATSLELTAVEVYQQALELDVLDDDVTTLFERLLENHEATAAEMQALTEGAGGDAWPCPNPWLMDRGVRPILEAIAASDDIPRDVVNFAIGLENLATATHQSLTTQLSTSEQRTAVANAAAQEARHSAAIVITVRGAEGYINPNIATGEIDLDAEGIPEQYAIPTTFGSLAQIELVVGAPDQNGVRPSFSLQTPAANSYVYNELEPTC